MSSSKEGEDLFKRAGVLLDDMDHQLNKQRQLIREMREVIKG